MSKPVYLYRAVLTEPMTVRNDEHGWTDTFPAGYVIGRQSGYLSRSAAVTNGSIFIKEKGGSFEVVKSEPVRFLTAAEKTEKRIAELEHELASLRGSVADQPRTLRGDVDRIKSELGFDPLDSLVNNLDRYDNAAEHRLIDVDHVDGGVVGIVSRGGHVNLRVEPFSELHVGSPLFDHPSV